MNHPVDFYLEVVVKKKRERKKRRATLERERGTATLKARLAEIAPEIGALYPGPSSPFNWP